MAAASVVLAAADPAISNAPCNARPRLLRHCRSIDSGVGGSQILQRLRASRQLSSEAIFLAGTYAGLLILHLTYTQLNDTYIVAFIPLGLLIVADKLRDCEPRRAAWALSAALSMVLILLTGLWMRGNIRSNRRRGNPPIPCCMPASSQTISTAPSSGPHTMDHTTPGSRPELLASVFCRRATHVSTTLCTILSTLGCTNEKRKRIIVLSIRGKTNPHPNGKLSRPAAIEPLNLKNDSCGR